MNSRKIGVIGAGDIGFTIAELLSIKGYDVIIYNRYHEENGKPSAAWLSKVGRLMDATDGLQLPNCGSVSLSSNLEDLNGVFATVITAGAKRSSPTETREELAEKNAKIIKGFSGFISKNPKTLIMIISNPVDALTQILIEDVAKITGKSKETLTKKIIGVSLVDSMRLKNLVREYLLSQFIPASEIETIAIGEHGPSMVPLMSMIKVNGKKFEDIAPADVVKTIREQTILRGNDIIKLTGASSVYGPAYAALYMVLELCEKDEVVLPCSCFDGKRAIGNFVKFKSATVNEIVNLPLNDLEKEAFEKSKVALDKQYALIVDRLNKNN